MPAYGKVMSMILSSLLLKVFFLLGSLCSFYPEMHLLGCEVCLRSGSQRCAPGIRRNQKSTPSQLTSIFGLLWNLN